MTTKWIVSEVPPVEKIDEITNELGTSRIVSAILAVRGFDAKSAKAYIDKDASGIYDPFLMKDMDKAVERLKKAISLKEKITVFGDYDADGVTSCALLVSCLEELGGVVDYYIPDRETEGYGVSRASVDLIKERNTKLILTVDCGITAVEECEYAKEFGLEMIITDHHECSGIVPDAVAVIDAKQEECSYPFDYLAGVGVALKLAQALLKDKYSYAETMDRYSELAMIGSVADIVPLTDENRIICNAGLAKIKNTANYGIKALLDVSGIEAESINASKIGFVFAPKINAVGRLENASRAISLFLANTYDEAYAIANEMNEYNIKRQKIEAEILDEAVKMLEEKGNDDKVIVLCNKNWHHGVVGIVSSRLAKKYMKPCILISEGTDGLYKGSGRSVNGFSIYDALDYSKGELVSFGGHELAVGLTLEYENIDSFREKINEYAKTNLTEEMSVSTIVADCEMRGRHLNMAIAEELQLMQPFGTGNSQPVFFINNMTVQRVLQIGSEKQHLKLQLLKDGVSVGAVAFGFGTDNKIAFNDVISVMACLDINEFRGVRSVQLRIIDIK